MCVFVSVSLFSLVRSLPDFAIIRARAESSSVVSGVVVFITVGKMLANVMLTNSKNPIELAKGEEEEDCLQLLNNKDSQWRRRKEEDHSKKVHINRFN